MAYRLPTERKDRGYENYTTSYLDDFLETIESLPNEARSVFAEVYNLEQKITSIDNDAQSALNEAIRRAQAKGTPVENVRRQYHEFIHLQTAAMELSDKKLDYVKNVHDSLNDAISHIDTKLVDFETQLKREGRWPTPQSNTRPKLTNDPVNQEQNKIDSDKEKQTSILSPTENVTTTRTTNKSRRRESTAATNTNISNQKAKADNTKKNVEEKDTDVIMTDLKRKTQHQDELDQEEEQLRQIAIEPSDASSADKTPYCTCRRVSFGSMIGCENPKCPIEWYHFECLGLKEVPKGTWFCPQCVTKSKRKSGGGRRKH